METIAVILVVGAAAVLILRRFVRSLKGRRGCGDCRSKCEAESSHCEEGQ